MLNALQLDKDCSLGERSTHIVNIGELVEENENKMRNILNEIYFGKTQDIVNSLRSVVPLADQKQMSEFRNDLAQAIGKRQVSPKPE